MDSTDWSAILSNEDPQMAYSMFSNIFTEKYVQCFLLKTYKTGYETETLVDQGTEEIDWHKK